ncbi:MAG: 2-nitropropane dioxygenase [Bacteroidetes bacterium GWF2_38_335]|nr:MAG: 2-nitropropane dioxygenase [Bacteroidetes bacterium GWF2_38_335]OFY77623.1 MAG: 2-nitropropane dioxygenase [Bacteroidetes bacterium RIFOXYA12_FULL_38_20]HBS87254.1 nitronate monooxygenase [Bacteroidales bacterium]
MNKITSLFEIKYPIIQGGMIWCSGWELAAAVSNGGGLGLIGSGSMTPEILLEHISKCKKATNKPFGINIPLLFPSADEFIQIAIKENIKVVFTSAGNPAKYTATLKQHGIKVVHVVANVKFAKKCEEAGTDAVVAEGFEAGGHNGKEETTTMAMIPQVRKEISIPLIAAGGIATGSQMLAAFALGADGVQVGSRFVASQESSAHPNFKQKILDCNDGSTKLTLKQLVPVRLIKNKFLEQVEELEKRGATNEELLVLLGKGRAKSGMFEGNEDEGEMEIGQVSGLINTILPASEIIKNMIAEFNAARNELTKISF